MRELELRPRLGHVCTTTLRSFNRAVLVLVAFLFFLNIAREKLTGTAHSDLNRPFLFRQLSA